MHLSHKIEIQINFGKLIKFQFLKPKRQTIHKDIPHAIQLSIVVLVGVVVIWKNWNKSSTQHWYWAKWSVSCYWIGQKTANGSLHFKWSASGLPDEIPLQMHINMGTITSTTRSTKTGIEPQFQMKKK